MVNSHGVAKEDIRRRLTLTLYRDASFSKFLYRFWSIKIGIGKIDLIKNQLYAKFENLKIAMFFSFSHDLVQSCIFIF